MAEGIDFLVKAGIKQRPACYGAAGRIYRAKTFFQSLLSVSPFLTVLL